jgi:hypothetical protein
LHPISFCKTQPFYPTLQYAFGGGITQARLLVQRPESRIKTMLHKFPCCKTGELIIIELFGIIGPPEKYLLKKQLAAAV